MRARVCLSCWPMRRGVHSPPCAPGMGQRDNAGRRLWELCQAQATSGLGFGLCGTLLRRWWDDVPEQNRGALVRRNADIIGPGMGCALVRRASRCPRGLRVRRRNATCGAYRTAPKKEGNEMDKHDIARLRTAIRQFERPVLSLYANTNWADPSSSPDAVVARVKNTLRELNVPESLAKRVVNHFKYSLPRSRVTAVFANQTELEVVPFHLEFIHDASQDHVEASYGEPYLTPLVAASERPPHLVVHAERDEVRLFELFMGQAKQLRHEVRARTPAEEDHLKTSDKRLPRGLQHATPVARSPLTAGNVQNQPKYLADRGDAATQLAHERITHLQKLFYQNIAEGLPELLNERGAEHVVLMGPERDAHLFRSTLAPQVDERVVAVEANTPGDEPTTTLIERTLLPVVEEVEREQRQELVAEIVEDGVTGAERCLKELQQGRLYTLAIFLGDHRHLFINRPSGYVATTRSDAAKADAAGSVEPIELLEWIPELAEQWGARLVFIEEMELAQRMDGMGALRRW